MYECISRGCRLEPLPETKFCAVCLDGLLTKELHIDDLVPDLENAVYPVWDRITEEKKKLRKGLNDPR